MYPDDRLYSKEHEWVRLEGEEVVLGITHFAQDELGEVVFVELPELGQSFEIGDEIGTIESVKAVAELYTPVPGEVIASNKELLEAPEKVNEDPHGEAWLVRLKPASDFDTAELMSAEKYQEFIEAG